VKTKKKVDEAWKARVKEEAKANSKTKEAPKEKSAQTSEPLPKPDFIGFISGLGMQALLFMEGVSDPQAKDKLKPDYQQARYLIDLIDMLEKKTKGNLTQEEANFIENLLYDLRIRYLKQ
jgi:hypothetical protein